MSALQVTWLCLEWPRPGHHSGGVGRYALRMAERLRGHVRLSVVALHGAEPLDGVDLRTVAAPQGRVGRYYGAPWTVREAVRRTRPDVVHSHGDDFLLPRGLPVVRTFHGSSLREAHSSRGLRRANHYVLAATELVSRRRAALALAVGPESQQQFGCEVVTPPYLPLEARPARAAAEVPTAVFIGDHAGRKRGHLAERAWDAVRARHPEARLVVVGPADDARRWSPWVEHVSGADDAEVARLLAEAWVLLAPSSYEGFGIPAVEALASGVPVVATSNPGIDYVAGLGDRALPVDVVDVSDLERAVAARVAAGPLLTPEEARAASAVAGRLAADGSAERLVELYHGVLAGGAPC